MSILDHIDLSAADRILVAGQWIKIKPGSLAECPGLVLRVPGDMVAVFSYVLPDGTEGFVRVDRIDGWAPLKTVHNEPFMPPTPQVSDEEPDVLEPLMFLNRPQANVANVFAGGRTDRP